MNVAIWGCRGSIPAPGSHSLRYGGESTCIAVWLDDGGLVIIDAGSGIRKLGQQLLREASGTDIVLLLSHAHWDHLMGFPFFRPAYFSQFRIHLCGGKGAQESVMRYLAKQMEAPFFPVSFSELRATFDMACCCDSGKCNHALSGGGTAIICDSIPLSHPNGGYGFRLRGKTGSLVYLSDNELGFSHPGAATREQYVDFCRGVTLLLHDAQYTDSEYEKVRTWGHSTFRDAVDLAIDAGVQRLGFLHHDPDRTDDALDQLVTEWQSYIAKRGSSVKCFACAEGMSFSL